MRQITIVIFAVILFFLSSCMPYDSKKYVEEILKDDILEQAAMNLQESPVTITSFIAERSVGTVTTFIRKGIIGGLILWILRVLMCDAMGRLILKTLWLIARL